MRTGNLLRGTIPAPAKGEQGILGVRVRVEIRREGKEGVLEAGQRVPASTEKADVPDLLRGTLRGVLMEAGLCHFKP